MVTQLSRQQRGAGESRLVCRDCGAPVLPSVSNRVQLRRGTTPIVPVVMLGCLALTIGLATIDSALHLHPHPSAEGRANAG